jgi:hypothetical protein
MDCNLYWRTTTRGDLAECLSLHPAKNGAENLGRDLALQAWQQLFHMAHASRSAVVERRWNDRAEIVGFGFATFVKKSFAEAEVRNPKPGLNGRILESIVLRKSVVATYEQVRDANTQGDLEQVILDTSWKHTLMYRDEVDEVRILLGQAYQELYAGYHLSRILTELVDERDWWHLAGQKTFQIVDRFEAFRQENPVTTWNADRALVAVTVESMRVDPHSVAAGLFQYRHRPQFGFARGEQELLEAALSGMDDEAASKSLFVSVAALKRRWANIFDRVAATQPDLIPLDGNGKRGLQKRPRILAWVRNHPEELRPFDPSKRRDKRDSGSVKETGVETLDRRFG